MKSVRTALSCAVLLAASAAAYANCATWVDFGASHKTCVPTLNQPANQTCCITLCISISGDTKASVTCTPTATAWTDPSTTVDPPLPVPGGHDPTYDPDTDSWYAVYCYYTCATMPKGPPPMTLTVKITVPDPCGGSGTSSVSMTAPPAP